MPATSDCAAKEIRQEVDTSHSQANEGAPTKCLETQQSTKREEKKKNIAEDMDIGMDMDRRRTTGDGEKE